VKWCAALLTGLAFQLIDDALDFRASSAALGNPALADVRLGVATAPVLLTMEQYPGRALPTCNACLPACAYLSCLPARKPAWLGDAWDIMSIYSQSHAWLLRVAELSTLVERKCCEPGDMEQALAWIEASGGVARTEQLAAAYAAKAVAAIRTLEPSEPRAALIALTRQVLTRNK
jgi:geranylgeranyl pyrophosphate synthase